MEEQAQEQAQLDLDSMTVLLMPHQDDPFQDVDEEKGSVTGQEELPAVGPDEWLED